MGCHVAEKPQFRREDRVQNGVVFSSMYLVCGDHEHQVCDAPYQLVMETFHGQPYGAKALVSWWDKDAAEKDRKARQFKREAMAAAVVSDMI